MIGTHHASRITMVTDQDITRRILQAVLDRLEAGAPRPAAPEPPPAAAPGRDTVVLVVLDPNTLSAAPAAPEPGREAANPVRQSEPPAPHPAQARFALPPLPSCGTAPKMCLLEPARVCVNSGACERLGY